MSKILNPKNTDGFTFIEFLVVLLIIANLIAIALPSLISQGDKAKDKAAESTLANATRSLQILNTSGSFSGTEAELIAQLRADNPGFNYYAYNNGFNPSLGPKDISFVKETPTQASLCVKSVAGTVYCSRHYYGATNEYCSAATEVLARECLTPTYLAQVLSYPGSELMLSLGNTNGLTDLSGNGRNGTGQGYISIGTATPGPLLSRDQGATNFDGGNDAVQTNYTTQRNYIQNPDMVGPLNLTNKWNPSSSAWGSGTFTATSIADPDGGPNMAQLDAVHDSSSSDLQTQFDSYPNTTMPVNPGETVSAQIELKHVSGPTYSGGLNNIYHFYLMFFNSSGSYLSALGGNSITNYQTGEWKTYQVSGVVPEGAATAKTSLRFRSSIPNVVNRHYVRRPQLIQGSAFGPYFSGNGHIDSSNNWITGDNESGWGGAENKSFSDIGTFANGTSRTFMTWLWVNSGTGNSVVMSNANGYNYDIPLRVNGDNGQAEIFVGGTYVPFDGTPFAGVRGQWAHAAIVVDEPNNTAKLYVNGVQAGATKTVTGQWASGGLLSPFYLGKFPGQYFDGKLAWASVNQGALSAQNIEEAYRVGKFNKVKNW